MSLPFKHLTDLVSIYSDLPDDLDFAKKMIEKKKYKCTERNSQKKGNV